MVLQVVSNKQKRLGYIVEDVFIPVYIADNCIKDLCVDKTVFGVLVRDKLITQGKDYKVEQDYLKHLRNLRGILSLKSICFIEREPSDDELCDLSSYWRVSRAVNYFCYTITDNSLKPLAFMLVKSRLKLGSTCHILMFEVLDKSKGLGTRIISEVLQVVSLRGYSCVTALDFWSSVGAEFTDGKHFKISQKM